MRFFNKKELQQAAADLRAGAEVIERNGWHQGDYYKRVEGLSIRDCPVCAAGALSVAVANLPLPRISNRLTNALQALQEHVHAFSVGNWNDQEEQTAENVIKTIRECADRLEAGGW